VFTARYGLSPYIKADTFSLQSVNIGSSYYTYVPAGALTLKVLRYIQSSFQHSTFLNHFKSSSEMYLKTLVKSYG
jgi:hypothetical protein